MKEISGPIKLYLTSKCVVPRQALKIGKVNAGLDMTGFDLAGKTGVKNRVYFTEGLQACTGGVVLGKQLNMFHENSSIYKDAVDAQYKIFPAITEKILKMARETKEKIQVALFGGWGYGSNHNIEEVEKSHNLFNNIALCIEENLPEKEGIEVPLLTIWGKLDSKKPDAVYARGNTIVLISDIFKSMFNKGKCDLDREGIINFLKKHYEEVQIPKDVNIVAEESYTPPMGFMDSLYRKKKISLLV